MQLILCQPDIAWEDRPANHARIQAMLRAQPPQPNDLLVLPEMFNTGFSMNTPAVLDPPDQPGRRFLVDLARQYNIFILAGLVTPAPTGLPHNTALAIAPDGRILAQYHKLHLFSFAQEDRHYQPGQNLVTFPLPQCIAAPLICYDLRFPELFRAAAARDVQLMLVIANWPASRALHWNTLLRARAIENQCFVAGVNCVGRDPCNTYAGQSQIIDPQGGILALADDRPQLLSATLDFTSLAQWRAKFPAQSDRRWDNFAPK